MRASVLRWVLAIVTLLVLILFFWPKPVPPPPTDLAMPPGVIPKCPDHLPLTILEEESRGWVLVPLTTVALSGDQTSVVEVNDCQRLIDAEPVPSAPPKLSYGPLVMIFSGDSVKTLPVGLVVDSGPDSGMARPQRATAVIYSWPERNPTRGDYPALGIKAGWNCLFLTPNGTTVTARMVPVRKQEQCMKPPGSEGTDLDVVTQAPPVGMTEDDIPAVARWAWSTTPNGPTNSIWVRCGNVACDIGPRGFKPEAPLPSDVQLGLAAKLGTTKDARRVLAFKGWYDQQMLAVESPAGGLAPSGTLATLIPWPDLGSQNSDGPFSNWQNVALAYLPQDIEGYNKKLNFEQGINEIRMRRGLMADAVPAGKNVVRPCSNSGDEWWAKIISRTSEQYFCAQRYVHNLPASKMPGTVRWQWLDEDEKTWVRCPTGCCPIA